MKTTIHPRANDPTGITWNDCEEAKRRVAAALGANPNAIELNRYELELAGWAFRCTGSFRGRRFFAKIYLNQFKPPLRRIPRYVTPENELELLRRADMLFGGDVGNEYRMFEKIGRHDRDGNVPTLLGRSAKDSTLVFEEVEGTRMDAYVKWRRWPSAVRMSKNVIVRAGRWLRNLHDTTSASCQRVSAEHLVETIRAIVILRKLDSTRYGDWALRVMNAYLDRLESRTVPAPQCVCHGDFSLANLIWDSRHDRLRVIDFEHSAFGNVLHDLCSLTFNLRAHLLNPLSSSATVNALEGAFWRGYGSVAGDTAATVNAISTARLFYFLLPRLSHRRQRRGWIAGTEASLYMRWLEPTMIERALRNLGWSAQALAPGFAPVPRLH